MPERRRARAFAVVLTVALLSGCSHAATGGSPAAQATAAAPNPVVAPSQTPAASGASPAGGRQPVPPGASKPAAPKRTKATTSPSRAVALPGEETPVNGAQGGTQTRTVTETQTIAYATRTVDDSSLAKGKTVVRTAGKTGLRTLTYRVTVTGGTQTGKKLIKSTVTRQPVTEVVAVGTKTNS